jgi:hypothetical protein
MASYRSSVFTLATMKPGLQVRESPTGALLDSRGCPPKMHAKAGHDEAARALSAWPLFVSTGWNPSCYDDQPISSAPITCGHLHQSPSLVYRPLYSPSPRVLRPASPTKEQPPPIDWSATTTSYHTLIAASPTETSRLPGRFPTLHLPVHPQILHPQ